jgi:gliding motility-associated lipoprotein GldH
MNLSKLSFLGLFLFLGIALSSCQPKDALFTTNVSCSENLEWRKDQPITIQIPVNQNAYPLRFFINFRYATGYKYDKLMLRMTETTPEGVVTKKDIDIPVRDEQGEFIGDKGYDIIDLEYEVDSKKQFPMHGQYTYVFEQMMPGIDVLHYAMELGVTVKDRKQ